MNSDSQASIALFGTNGYDMLTMQIRTFSQFKNFIQPLIPTRKALFQGDLGLKRSQYFMNLLGNPQEKIQVIHVAGTSGKGSTAYIVSHLLQSQGFRVGLSVSPHILDIRERMQLNNKLPSKKLLLRYFNEILPAILSMKNCEYGMPTFFEINVGLAFYMFWKEGIDYAVIETGLGGLFDATNVINNKNKLCIITRLGLDHTEILGKTISKITKQKAGIINNQNTTISIQQSKTSLAIIKDECNNKQSTLHIISSENYRNISVSSQGTFFDFKLPISKSFVFRNIRLGLAGKHQAENCSLALAALCILSKQYQFNINEKKLKNSLKKISIPGRFEIIRSNNMDLIIDGAHNPQKMRALIKNLRDIYPGEKFIFIVAFKKSKDYKKILLEIIPSAKKIYLTSFSKENTENHLDSTDNNLIAKFLISQNFHDFKIAKGDISCISALLEKENRQRKSPFIITGSFYLIEHIHRKFPSLP